MIKANLREVFDYLNSDQILVISIKIQGVVFTSEQLRLLHDHLVKDKSIFNCIELELKYYLSRRKALIVVLEEDFYDKLSYDFTDLKKIVKEEIVDQFDHATVFNQNTPHIELARELKSRDHHVILVDYQPTSENMVIDFAAKIKKRLPENISLFSLKLQETESSFAEWFASDNL